MNKQFASQDNNTFNNIGLKDGDVAFIDNIVSVEDLPKRYVFYPGFYGAFFAFADKKDDFPSFCSCSKKSIENYLNFRLKDNRLYSDPSRNFILNSSCFPYCVVTTMMSQKVTEDKSIISLLKFEDKLCHVCNKKIPKYEYCHEMYGGKFIRMYGWYINQTKLELGIPLELDLKQIKGSDYPEELKEIVEELPDEPPPNYWTVVTGAVNMDINIAKAKQSEYGKTVRKLENYLQNLLRLKLGYKKVGEGWVSETSVYYMLKNLFPNYQIIHHYRPAELEGLEIDVYIPELKVGIEYQGIQHYKPLKIFGGVESFKKLIKRDARKKVLCEKNGIKLLCLNYKKKITEAWLKNVIGKG